MSLYKDLIPEVCPICGAELGLKEDDLNPLDESGGLLIVSCPSCQFKMEIPYGGAQDIKEMMMRETEKEPNDYSAALHPGETPNEDPMLEYM